MIGATFKTGNQQDLAGDILTAGAGTVYFGTHDGELTWHIRPQGRTDAVKVQHAPALHDTTKYRSRK